MVLVGVLPVAFSANSISQDYRDLTIEYLTEENGATVKIAPDYKASLLPNSTYSIPSPSVVGYQVENSDQSTVAGTLEDSDKTIQEYEIFAAVETRVLNTRESGFRYYQQSGDLSENAFQELLTWLTENALYDTGIKPEYGEQVVLLSTCSYHTENGRFLVAAKKVGSE